MDGLQCGKEMERDGNGGPLRLKKPFHQPLVEEKKVKEAKRKVVLFFYSLDRMALGLFRDMGSILEICQTFYMTGFSGQKFYTLKVRKLRLFLQQQKNV